MGYSGSDSSASGSTAVNGSSPELSPIEKSVLARQESLQRLTDLRLSRDRNAAAQAALSELPPASGALPFMTPLNGGATQSGSQQQQPADFDPRASIRVFSRAGQIPAANSAEEQAANGTSSTTAPAEPQASWFAPSGLGEQQMSEAGPSQYLSNGSIGATVVLPPSPGGESPGGRARKASAGPAWAVTPRILLVDDDQVSRKIFSKFLQVSGCTIDIAVDGIGAVNKMNLEKYDLVLMVRFVYSRASNVL